MLIDVHSHLNLKEYYNSRVIFDIINVAKQKGQKYILEAGVDYETNKRVLKLSKEYDIILPCLGLYPDTCYESKDIIEKILKQLKNEEYFAISEVGLDFSDDTKDKLIQINLFKRVIEIANDRKKVLIVHTRKAEKESIEILKEFCKTKVILHCFSGKINYVKELSKDPRFFFSIPTNVLRSQHFQNMIDILPLSKIFTETDSPFLSPSKEEFPNKPYNVEKTIEEIAKIKKLDKKEVENMIFLNFQNVFY
ncbi:MAG: TatD family hydrolase [Candidatus Nanoarchaeia archaeon]|nr:TatD family hydrolase [Candidatus Nanoarchaeia archaeon]